jgi:hypothetical protein
MLRPVGATASCDLVRRDTPGHQPDHRQRHHVLVRESKVRTGGVALHGHDVAARRDAPRVDDVLGKAVRSDRLTQSMKLIATAVGGSGARTAGTLVAPSGGMSR